jgi:hypothetical protein
MQMAKMSELDLVLQEFHAAAKALINAADSLRDFYSTPTKTPAQEEPPKPPQITLAQVRAVLAEKSRDGHTEKVRELLKEFGADKLSNVDPGCYEALFYKAEVLGNG